MLIYENQKVVIKTTTTISISLLFSWWFNNNTPITSLIRTFMNENASVSKILDIFLYSALCYTELWLFTPNIFAFTPNIFAFTPNSLTEHFFVYRTHFHLFFKQLTLYI